MYECECTAARMLRIGHWQTIYMHALALTFGIGLNLRISCQRTVAVTARSDPADLADCSIDANQTPTTATAAKGKRRNLPHSSLLYSVIGSELSSPSREARVFVLHKCKGALRRFLDVGANRCKRIVLQLLNSSNLKSRRRCALAALQTDRP